MRIVLYALGVALCVSTLQGQVSGVVFDVASVKRNVSGGSSSSATPPEGYIATNFPLRWLIARAYNIPISDLSHRLIGGPGRILDANFDINAKTPPNTSPDRLRSMLQSLLADRFKLRVHAETRERPVYALVVARPGRLGDDLRPTQQDCELAGEARQRAIRAGGELPPSPRDAKNRQLCRDDPSDPAPRGARRYRYAGPLAELVMSIQGAADRPIIDATQLTGNFEWQLIYTSARVPDASAEFPSIGVALEEQLGLKLEPRMVPLEVLVIDSLELPTPD